MHENSTKPVDIAEKLVTLVSQRRGEEAASLYDDNAVIRVMLTIPEPLLVSGSEIKKSFREMDQSKARMYDDIRIVDFNAFQGQDPEVVVVQWIYESRINDETVTNQNLIILRIRDGKVIESTDYHNHAMRSVADGNSETEIQKIRDFAEKIG